MVAEKRIYSTTALQNCYRALRSARWSVRRKDEHMTRCCEVRELYAKCQVNLGCVLLTRICLQPKIISTWLQTKGDQKTVRHPIKKLQAFFAVSV